MKKILLILLLLPLLAAAKPDTLQAQRAPADSAQHGDILQGGKWKFMEGDAPAMAAPGYDDSAWRYTDPNMHIAPGFSGSYSRFSSVGWFRYHLYADSALCGKPLGLLLNHNGASEVYLDGKKIASFGVINGRKGSVYYNPRLEPVMLTLPTAGPHVLAIRYANYDAQGNYDLYRVSFTGIDVHLRPATKVANDVIYDLDSMSFFPTLLFAIFLTLAVLHLLLYGYYRVERSNLYFSLFCLSLAASFLLYYLNNTSSNPDIAKLSVYPTMVIFSLICFSLSGFSNELFSRRRLRFRIVTALCIASPFLALVSEDSAPLVAAALLCFVLIEAIILTVRALLRKEPGARIIGAGILFFSLFILFICSFTIINRGMYFDHGSSAEIFLYTAFCAVLSMPVSMSVYLSRNVALINKDLKEQLHHVEELSARSLSQEQEKQALLAQQNVMLEREVSARTEDVVRQHEELKSEKRKSDELLLNILPGEVAEELKQTGQSRAKYFDEVTVMFTDFVDFTSAAERMTPEALVSELDVCFRAFDNIMSAYGIEKIKTIGDAYLAVAGLPEPDAQHAVTMAAAALEIVAFMAARRQQQGHDTFEVRVGLHSGNVVAGIVGVRKFAYDIWGDTVNIAARMEQNSAAGKINISQSTYNLLSAQFACTYRGPIKAKNKGELNMYFIDGPR